MKSFALSLLCALSVFGASYSVSYNPTNMVMAPSGLSVSNVTSSSLSSVAPKSLVTSEYIAIPGSTNLDNWMAIQTWGDSLTEGSGVGGTNSASNYPNQLGLYTGFRVANGGVGGETSTQILTRQTASSNTWSRPTIIWAGRNNYSFPTTVLADIASMVTNLWSQGNTNRYLVMSILNGSFAGEQRGGAGYAVITNLNAQLAALYGSNYIDVRSYLVSRYNPAIPQDVTDYNNDIPPSSLRYDTLHLNTNGYAAVAAYITTNSLPALRGAWGPAASPAAVAAWGRQPGPIGSETPNAGNFTLLTATTWNPTNLGLNTTNPVVQFQIKQTATRAVPALGTTGGSFAILVPNNNYGLFAGVSGPGPFWMQSMRNDGATAYDIQLQPAGGNVTIGTTGDFPSYKLYVAGPIGTSGAITALGGLVAGTGGSLMTSIKNQTATLVAGTVTVALSSVTSSTRFLLTSNFDGGTPGWLRVSARSVGASFTITSSNPLDTSTVAWMAIEP